MTDTTQRSLDLVQFVAEAAWSKKARDIVAFDVRKTVFYTDTMVICSGTSDRHVRAISEHIEAAAGEAGLPLPSSEGRTHGRWVLMDFGEVTVHVFHELLREVYDLERLFGDAPRITISLKVDPSDDGWDF